MCEKRKYFDKSQDRMSDRRMHKKVKLFSLQHLVSPQITRALSHNVREYNENLSIVTSLLNNTAVFYKSYLIYIQ